MKKLANNNKLLKLIKMNKSISNDMPTAHVTIKKSRIKQYDKQSNTPIYYLKKDSEFELELFNPRPRNVLAVIELNNENISQGGLVLKPGERVFLERYLDIPKKFKFTIYQVNNTDQVREAIENNGSINIKFYDERIYYQQNYNIPNYYYYDYTLTNIGTPILYNKNNFGSGIEYSNRTLDLRYANNMFTCSDDHSINNEINCNSKKIETGQINKGSNSDQKFENVSNVWEPFILHEVKYKLLPLSQKINTKQDLNVKRYCTSCGYKLNKNDKFCAQCGAKI